METEKDSHVADERLILAQPSNVHQTENLITKLHNGNQLPEVPPQQINGDTNWNHFNTNLGVNPMKRHQENGSSPTVTQDLEQTQLIKNGGIKHKFNEPSSLGLHQSKKARLDVEVNGQGKDPTEDNVITGWSQKETSGMDRKLCSFPDISEASECDVARTPGVHTHKEKKLDNKNCNFSNGDMFSNSRNKQVPIPNGAMVTASPVEDIPGDLLEKTLSQYYPDHVSIAMQNNASEEHAIRSPAVSDFSEQARDSPSHTSGLPISPPNSASVRPDTISPESHTNSSYNSPFGMDGYPTEFQAKHHQQQHQQQQPYPLQDDPAEVEQHSQGQEGQVPGTVTAARPGSNLPDQNNTECLSQDFSPEPYLSMVEPSILLEEVAEKEADRFSPFTDKALERTMKNEDTESGHLSRGMSPHLQPQKSQQGQPYMAHLDHSNAAERSGFLGSPGSRQLRQAVHPQLTDDAQMASTDTKHQPPYRSQQDQKSLRYLLARQMRSGETDNDIPFKGGSEMLQHVGSYPELNWIDLNSPQPQQQMWKDFSPQQKQQTSMQSQGQRQDPDALQGFQMQSFSQTEQREKQMPDAYKPDETHDQAQHPATSEWQRQNTNTPPGLQVQSQMQAHKLQHISSQCSLSQQQVQHPFHSQIHPEHLCESTQQDIEHILSSDFLQQPQQPQQQAPSEEQQVLNALQPQPAQDPQGGAGTAQPQDPSQRHFDSLNRLKLEEFISLEKQLKSSNCKSQPVQQQEQQQTLSNPTGKNTPRFLDSSMPKAQPLQNDTAHFAHRTADGTVNQFKKATEMRQLQYSPNPATQKQYLQPHHSQEPLNHTNFPPPTQQQPQLPQGALNQHMGHMTAQMYPKTESQDSCAQSQQGQLQQHHRELQKHAALRLHLLQKQEKQAYQQNLEDFKSILQSIKTEHKPQCEPTVPQQVTNSPMNKTIKLEFPQINCDQSRQKSILATMEQQLKQYQLSPVFERKSLVIKSPKQVKVETSGPVTILSTNADLGGEDMTTAPQKKPFSDFMPTKKTEPNLHNFIESPMKLLDTPIKNLLDTPLKTQYEFPSCHCFDQISEKDEGPYYTHLGAAPNVASIREIMEKRFGQTGKAIRIEKVVYTGKEGKSMQGCPIAKWVIRRSGVEEKLLVLVRERAGHHCDTATLVVLILIWEGIHSSLADRLYLELSSTLRKHGALTNRRCALNEERTCACQGLDPETCGASFSFGCSWSMYYNGCKFARSKIPRKFKLLGDDHREEENLEKNLQDLATLMAPSYKQMAPEAYGNQVEYESRALDCRLGTKEGRPFSGVTACLDFCAHSHRDLHNMPSGSTLVCTLTREDNREIGKIPEDEQLHVLPLYKVSPTDEFGSVEAQQEKIKTGAIQVLSSFRRKVRMLAEPAKTCRQKKLEAKRAAANKPSNADTPNSKAEKNIQARLKQSTYESMGNNTSGTGPHPGLQQHPLSSHQQKNNPSHYPVSHPMHPSSFTRFPSPADSFPGTSQSGSPYQDSPTSTHPYLSPLRVANPYLNGANPTNSYPASLNPNNLYPGYQCNGNMPIDGYHPYYMSNPKHIDVYRHQTPESLNKINLPQLYSQQQYSPHQHYGVGYPPRYPDPSIQVNGYSNCNMRPNIHPMGHYPSFGPNVGADAQYLEAISRPPSAHPGLDCTAVGKGNQYGGYPSPYGVQNPSMFSSPQDSFHMQIKPEMNLHGANGMARAPPPPVNERPTNLPPPGYMLPNGGVQASPIAPPEPGTPKPKEDVWSDSEHNFLDPDIGGVAVAPSHGSILIECAKRELHATTPLKNPNRNHPTRISLVFYQHKSMNEAKHGLALWEAKMAEKAREKEEESERQGSDSTPQKNSGGKKAKREHTEGQEKAEPPYKRFIQTLTQRSMSCTTNSIVNTSPYAFTKVTGPYNRYI
ncbi:TET2 dioxygenase, partial [Amia calva]|nr:TET2 dioxygenase [Amia calva]